MSSNPPGPPPYSPAPPPLPGIDPHPPRKGLSTWAIIGIVIAALCCFCGPIGLVGITAFFRGYNEAISEQSAPEPPAGKPWNSP